MGSGCSSPLRRFGGKRSKQTRRNSSSASLAMKNEGIGDQDRGQQQQHQVNTQPQSTLKYIIDNEVTIQSELDEHPSTASYYTDGKNLTEDAKISENSSKLEPKLMTTMDTLNSKRAVVARMIGLNGSYTPHDRHLLVSPALSPAPSSTCYSPSPANSIPGCITPIDLNDLNEAFKDLTFGAHDARIKRQQQQSDLHNYQSQNLIQSQQDLINYVSIVFITTDTFLTSSVDQLSQKQQALKQTNNLNNLTIETIANSIESNLKSICDEHLFNLRFLNLSQTHLSKHFHINNLLDASMKLFQQEFKENSQRLIIILLSSNSTTQGSSTDSSNGANEKQSIYLDKRQLPIKIEAQVMNKLMSSSINLTSGFNIEEAKNLLKRWYNQTGSFYHLKPIYLIYPNILNASDAERESAWESWLTDSSIMLKAIDSIRENDSNLNSSIQLKSLFSSYLEFITSEQALQKRTLLIRNFMQPPASGNMSSQQQPNINNSSNYGSLNELARLLADPNKLTLKRSMNDEELAKSIYGWVNENFVKIIENIEQNQIAHGKHIPSFIESNLFTELTCQRHHLEYYLDHMTDSYETKCLNFYTSHILPILKEVVDCNESSIFQAQTGSSINVESSSIRQQLSASHIVFISGPKGCGKSTLFAKIIAMALRDFNDKVQIIYRFGGVTLDSLSSNRLLRSICEQFCQTQGENTTAASYIYSARRDIMNALNKIIKSQNTLIFLDELDSIVKKLSSNLDWLCEIEANPRVKLFIILETNSDLYKQVLGSYVDATHISLDNPSISEWAQMLTHSVKSKRLNSSGNLYDEFKRRNSLSDATTFTYSDLSNLINMCRIRQLNNEVEFPELSTKLVQDQKNESLKEIQQIIIKHLQYLLNPHQLCALFVMLVSSRNGLTESDITKIMTKISIRTHNEPEFRFSTALFRYCIIQLQPWLVSILSDKRIKIAIQKDFVVKAIEQYSRTLGADLVQEIQGVLQDYFNKNSKPKKGLLVKGDTGLTEPKTNINLAESSTLAIQTSEFINLLVLNNPAAARDYILDKYQFFLQFFYNSMPEEFIEDFERLKENNDKKSVSLEELQCLVNYISRSVYPLRYDGCQIYSQLYCRAYDDLSSGKLPKGKKFNDILNQASSPPVMSLLPISEGSVHSFIKTRIGVPFSNTTSSAQTLEPCSQKLSKPPTSSQPNGSLAMSMLNQKIFPIKDNHRHIIVIYPDKGDLSVWDIYEERAVRTINNLDQPKDLRMIDQKRAVILCNRELRVYDLDSGSMLTKLKGVMNQKMPYFEVFGDNYVVALARNRMYVNMLNLSTGELETTFKVGEDRFLNSLLVSASGGICVCGDETQKPFPLLVWNLNERRLLYDLRLDRHEFITSMSAISDDGHFVVSVCRQIGEGDVLPHGSSSSSTSYQKGAPNFIVIYDLNSGTMFKKWKPGIDSCGVAITLSADRSGKVINTVADNSILIWDLGTGSKRHTLIGHSAPVDVIKVQSNRLFTMDSTCRDQSLRIWDIDEGLCLAVFSPDAPVSCCQLSLRGDALVCGFAAETRLSTLVICKNETVNDVVKRNKRRKSSKTVYIFDEPPSRKSSS